MRRVKAWRDAIKRHRILLLGGCALALVAALAGCGASDAQLQGSDMGMTPAPQFSLVDQSGATVSLAELRGRPVVVTFLYTHCPGPCPLTAEKLRKAAASLGAKASKVAWVAVSLDPQGDTPDAAKQFVATHQLTGKLRFLMGNQQQLEPVWNAYFVAVQQNPDTQSSDGSVMHSIGAFAIDKQGRERVYLNDSFAPTTLANDLTILLAE